MQPQQTPIQFKLCCIMHSVSYGTCPAYLTNIVEPAGAGHTRSGLRSTSSTNYTLPRLRTKNVHSRTQDRPHGTDCPKICVPWPPQLSFENS